LSQSTQLRHRLGFGQFVESQPRVDDIASERRRIEHPRDELLRLALEHSRHEFADEQHAARASAKLSRQLERQIGEIGRELLRSGYEDWRYICGKVEFHVAPILAADADDTEWAPSANKKY
jgi:hypothetical protein